MMRNSSGRRDRGASLVEFALGAMIFLMLLFGVMDWAWVFHQHQTIAARAAMAARWASAHSLDSQEVASLVNCGSLTCTGTTSYYADATVTVSGETKTDTIDTITTVTRNYAVVRVSGYKIRHFIPGFSVTGVARDIVAKQPMECLASWDCTCPGSSCPMD